MTTHHDDTEPNGGSIKAFYTAVRLTRPLLRHISASVDAGSRIHGVTVGQRAVLEALYDGGLLPGPELVAALALKRQFVFRMLAETDAAGLTTRKPNPNRARAYLHGLTDQGRAVLSAIRTDELDKLNAFAATQDSRDIAVWATMQRRLNVFFAQTVSQQDKETQRD